MPTQIGDKMKKVLIILTILLVIPTILSQDAGVILNHYGFGENPREAKFTIHSSGSVPISNITIYVDGEEYKKFDFLLYPKKGIDVSIYLDPGQHQVEVRTAEGAYDSVNVTTSPVENFKPQKPEEKIVSFTRTRVFKIALVLLVLLAVVLWLLTKKQKLDLSH